MWEETGARLENQCEHEKKKKKRELHTESAGVLTCSEMTAVITDC